MAGRMKAYLGLLLLVAVSLAGTASGEVRVVAIGAHPDDCDLGAGEPPSCSKPWGSR